MNRRFFARRPARALRAAILLLVATRFCLAQDFIDATDDYLKFGSANGEVTARISGLVDMEEYYVRQPPPGLIYEKHSFLTNPRLTLNLDAQLGKELYVFAQADVDRGFDPDSEGDAQARADQYALRYTPWEDGRINVQAGKFATVVGSWALRDDPWQNPFITAPVPYENLTGLWDAVAAPSGSVLPAWVKSGKNLRLPIIWEGSYASGASIFGTVGQFDYAAEIKNASLSSRPETWSLTDVGFSHPTFSDRLGYRPSEEWNLGVSSSVGSYLKPSAADTVAAGEGLSDYREILIGEDASYAWHHWQLWAECFETRFEEPRVGNADTVAYYVEGRYQFAPDLFAALRWNQQLFNSLPKGEGESGDTPWGPDLDRIDAAVTYRFSPHLQAKIQYSYLIQDDPVPLHQNFVAAQITLRF